MFELTCICFSFLETVAFLKLLFPKPYEKEDIEKFKQRKTYVEYLKAKGELVACLSAKERGLWLLHECFSKTWRKVAGVALIALSGQHLPVLAINPLAWAVLRACAHYLSLRQVATVVFGVLNFAEAHLHVFAYDLASKNQKQLT